MENENRDNMGSSNVGSKSMAFQIDLNQTPVLSPRGGDGSWMRRATETSVSVCSVCRTEVQAHEGAASGLLHPGWKCLRCLLKNNGSSSSAGGCMVERFDLNASPPREADDEDVVGMASRNDGTNEASISLRPFPPSREKVEQRSSIAFGTSRRSQLQSCGSEDNPKRNACPPGKLLCSSLPAYLMGDALQVWELAWRFTEVLELGQSFSFWELVSELVSPWLDCYLDSHLGRSTNTILAKIHGSLLKLLVSELLSMVGAFGCPDIDSRESKSRRGKKKDSNCLAALRKTKLSMLPVNGLTWHEIARRYMLALLSMDGNLESTEIASSVSGKVFHCLHGDGGIVCGSLTGIAALKGDAVVLEDAMNSVFGPLQRKDEIFGVCERESDTDSAQAVEVNNDVIPEWAQVLEPVRKLPTNVGARLKKCVEEALERNPPEWAKKELKHSISKAVYKANASGPTKRAVISVLENRSNKKPCPKTEKKETAKIKRVSDLISQQCRILLRCIVSADEGRVLCNLMGKNILNSNDNDEKGLLRCPAMVSRPLDFRTIDVRLAAGAYGGSHEAFIDDVREVWHNIRTTHGNQCDLVGLAEDMSQTFEELYEKQVLGLVNKVADLSSINGLNDDAVKERDNLLALIFKNPLPRAPWEEGICKVCCIDKDDDKVLLCDKCDSEYHNYCLNPPLLKIPKGDWYCPSCVADESIPWGDASGSVTTQSQKRRKHGKFSSKFLEDLAQLASLMELKECWEFTIEERIFLMKFLFEEALNSATIREHMDQCAPRAANLQHKLQSLTSKLKILKFKEEMLVNGNRQGDMNSDASSSLPAVDSEENSLKLGAIKKDISDLQDSIASMESELLKVSLRKDFLGRDSNGRVYWAFYSPGAHPLIVANGSLTFQECATEEFAGISDSDKWRSYESDNDIEQLLGWLRDSNEMEKELRESIIQLQSSKLKDGYTEHHILSKGDTKPMFSNGKKDLSADLLTTKAMTALEKRFGLCFGIKPTNVCQSSTSRVSQEGTMCRCECLELLWPSKYHCPSCHQSFLTSERQHSMENCQTLETVEPEKPPGVMGNIHDLSEKQKGMSLTEMPPDLGSQQHQHSKKSSIIPESSLRPLTGRSSEILRILKINLLDMDAALPEDALKTSRSHQDRRHAWRSFVKSATSIYQMVQTTIILEDAIKSEYLHSDWWYWSSPSTAAKIPTLSALALRIYMLDSAISYEKPFPPGAAEALEKRQIAS